MIPAFVFIAGTPPWFVTALALIVGACIGSFLNVVIVRLPAGESIARPGSHCACGKPIAWRDNIPVFSWLILRGKARCCGRPFSVRYPLVELLTALLFFACSRLSSPAMMVCGWVFVSSLICATFIDLDHMVIPDVFTLGLGGAGVVLSFLVPALHGQHSGYFALDSLRAGAESIEGLLIGSGLVLWIALIAGSALKKEAMGFGDVKFVGAIGAFCGWHGAVFAVFGGALVGTFAFLLALIGGPKKDRPAFGTQMPFGPMLAIAGGVYFLFVHARVDAWFANFAELF